jgi:hypothetical protein
MMRCSGVTDTRSTSRTRHVLLQTRGLAESERTTPGSQGSPAVAHQKIGRGSRGPLKMMRIVVERKIEPPARFVVLQVSGAGCSGQQRLSLSEPAKGVGADGGTGVRGARGASGAGGAGEGQESSEKARFAEQALAERRFKSRPAEGTECTECTVCDGGDQNEPGRARRPGEIERMYGSEVERASKSIIISKDIPCLACIGTCLLPSND